MQSPGLMKHARKLYWASTGVPPKTRVGTRMNKPKVKMKAKGNEKSVRPEKERNNEIKINIQNTIK